MGKTKKSTRFYLRWRLDQDYWKKLSPGEREWLQKFNGEYYRTEFDENSLHCRGEQRRELYRALNSAFRDVVTASSADVTKAVTKPVADRPSLRSRFYTPADYRPAAGSGSARATPARSLEDELLELLEETRQRLGEPADIVDLFDRIQSKRRAG